MTEGEQVREWVNKVVADLAEGDVVQAREDLKPLETYLNAQDIIDKERTPVLRVEISKLFLSKVLGMTQ